MSKRLIVLDDEEGFEFLFEHHLSDLIESGKLEFFFRTQSQEVEDLLSTKSTSTILLCDLIMPEVNGLEFSQKMINKFPDLKILIMSGITPETKLNFPFFSKPLDFRALRSGLNLALK